MVRRSMDDKLVPDVVTLSNPIGMNDAQTEGRPAAVHFAASQHVSCIGATTTPRISCPDFASGIS
jgi:hypothetical protein